MTNKHRRNISCDEDGGSDVYDVLEAFGVTCPAAQHAIKKLLAPGRRGHKNEVQDLTEARQCLDRAIEMAQRRADHANIEQALRQRADESAALWPAVKPGQVSLGSLADELAENYHIRPGLTLSRVQEASLSTDEVQSAVPFKEHDGGQEDD